MKASFRQNLVLEVDKKVAKAILGIRHVGACNQAGAVRRVEILNGSQMSFSIFQEDLKGHDECDFVLKGITVIGKVKTLFSDY